MVYYMTHPKHGTYPVYDTGEIERFKSHGWTLREDKPAAAPQGPGAATPPSQQAGADAGAQAPSNVGDGQDQEPEADDSAILDLSVAKMLPLLGDLSVERLQRLHEQETAGKTRASALDAIEAAIKAKQG